MNVTKPLPAFAFLIPSLHKVIRFSVYTAELLSKMKTSQVVKWDRTVNVKLFTNLNDSAPFCMKRKNFHDDFSSQL